MKIVVTGAKGQLGTSLQDAAQGSRDEYIFTDVEELDITNREAVREMMAREKVDVIVNCAAYTQVDRAEDDAAAAEVLNHHAVENLAIAAREHNAVLIHISTDYVFGGARHNIPCQEDEMPHPTGVYGKTKLAGEEAVKSSGCRYIILRTAWLYSPYGKNFMKTMLALTAERSAVNVVFDQVGTPTYAAHLAACIRHIIESRQLDKEGVYHYSNEGVCSWYDFAHAIAHLSGHQQCCVQPCHSNEFPSKVERPPYSVLDKSKVKATFGIEIAHWYEALKECLEKVRK